MITFKQFLVEADLSSVSSDSSPAAKEKGRAAIAAAAGIDAATLQKMQPYFKKAADSNLMAAYNSFVDAFPKESKAINRAKSDGVGPGELVLYFVFDNLGIGGKNSPIDVFMNGKPYAEVKAGRKNGPDAINNFKVTKDGDKAVTQLLKDLSDFNDTYVDITGDKLEGWLGSGKANTNPIKDWRKLDLKKLAGESSGGSKKSIDLILKKDGDLLKKGEDDLILNVKKAKSVAPIKNLLDTGGSVTVDAAISTVDKIIQRWVDQAFTDYITGKKFIFIETGSMKIRFVGEMTKDMLDLDYTNRNQPYAKVYLAPKKSKEKEDTPK